MKTKTAKRASARTKKAAPPPPRAEQIEIQTEASVITLHERMAQAFTEQRNSMATFSRARACEHLSTALNHMAEAALILSYAVAEGSR